MLFSGMRSQVAHSSSLKDGTQRRFVSRLYTSYTAGYVRPRHLTGPRPTVANSFRAQLSSAYGLKTRTTPQTESSTSSVAGDEGPNDYLVASRKEEDISLVAAQAVRPYVPLDEVGQIELQGDYLVEGGHYFDALRSYAVVAKAYSAAYPENHNQRAHIAVKLSRAFRLVGKNQSAVENAEAALFMLENNSTPQLDLVVEGMMELAQAREAHGASDAGLLYEDVIGIINSFHSMGNSHRTLRMIPRLARNSSLGVSVKFNYNSPYEQDRVFALGDYALQLAEAFYRKIEDQEGIVRVLTMRSQFINRKEFEMRDYSGKAGSNRGRAHKLRQFLTNAPTPSELLLYSPTVHQPYLDRSRMYTAPVGEEDTVIPASNRRVLDDGDPWRRKRSWAPQRQPIKRSTGHGTSMSEIYESETS